MKRDRNIVFQTPNFAAERVALLLEDGLGALKLEGVDLQLLAQATASVEGVARYEHLGRQQEEAALAQEDVGERDGAELDDVGRENAGAGGLLVAIEGDEGQVAELAVKVLRLEAEVALHEDQERRVLQRGDGVAQVRDVGANEVELALGLYTRTCVS